MELKQFFDELLVVAVYSLAVLLEVQNSSGLGLNFINIMVEHSCDLIGVLSSLDLLHLLSLPDFLRLLGASESVLNAEGVVTAMLLPKLLEVLAFSYLELEVPILDFDC